MTGAARSLAPRPLAGAGLEAIVLVLACALLASRLWLLEVDVGRRRALLLLVYGAVTAGAVLAPGVAKHVPAPLPRPIALAFGLTAIGVASFTSGTPAALPVGGWTIPASSAAAVAEEALFRRTMYARFERRGPLVAVLVTAAAFAMLHLPLYGFAALPVDLAGGLLLGWQRWASGSWTIPAATHGVANVLAVLR